MAFEFKNIITGDQSPSLSLPPTWEAMHSLEGAFSETQYIYQPPIQLAFENVLQPSFLSLGLGLGYNEILIICESLVHNKTPSLIRSFELIPELRECFISWINGNASVLNSVYDQILQLYAQKYSLPTANIHEQLFKLLEKDILRIEGPVELLTELSPMNCLLFDAFCAKTSPDLWTPEFLHSFFKKTAGEPCFMSTYACTGELRRALAGAGFDVEKRKGFAFKRESTFAKKKTLDTI
jgi:S-adenosyl-L-methionine-dependent methyltransferase